MCIHLFTLCISPFRSFRSLRRSRWKSSNFICDAWNRSWGSGSGYTHVSLPASWHTNNGKKQNYTDVVFMRSYLYHWLIWKIIECEYCSNSLVCKDHFDSKNNENIKHNKSISIALRLSDIRAARIHTHTYVFSLLFARTLEALQQPVDHILSIWTRPCNQNIWTDCWRYLQYSPFNLRPKRASSNQRALLVQSGHLSIWWRERKANQSDETKNKATFLSNMKGDSKGPGGLLVEQMK